MPSIAVQLRADRRRRQRRRRVAMGVLVAVPAIVLGARVLGGASEAPAGARFVEGATLQTAPAPSSVPTPWSSGLHPGLVAAYEQARAAAGDADHQLTITSGFRSAEEQAALLEAEIAERGSLAEALWWVFPPERSMHVQGLAIDVGDRGAADWLADEGARFGLCRTLAWEWWHFEWRSRWESAGACPAPARSPEGAPRP